MSPTVGTPASERPGVGRIAASTVGFVVLGIPVVGYLWDVLSDVLAGKARAPRLFVALVLLIVLAAMLRVLASAVLRLERGRAVPPPPTGE